MKRNRIETALFLPAILALLFQASTSFAARPVIELKNSAEIQKVLRDRLHIPFYFTVPARSILPLPADTELPVPNPAILVDYHSTSARRAADQQMGLRLLMVDSSKPRPVTAALLAETRLIEDGDILLSFRPEWYETLRYSHIQLGISHAALAYVDRDAKGKPTVRNLDMPMDTDTIGVDGKSQLSSKHYLEAPTVHVLRPKNLDPQQKKNILGWLRLLATSGKAAYGSKLVFNTNYASPNFRRGTPLTFVGDLGRLALRVPVAKQLAMYCSEFAWSVLSLKNCDPATAKEDFQKQDAPGCITPIFDPMSVFGTITTAADKSRPDLTVGLADGPIILTDALVSKEHGLEARNRILHRYFSLADGAPAHISSGHKAVEQSILSGNKDFYAQLEQYYKLTGLEAPETHPMFLPLFQGFNQSQLDNYSPTAFQVHAVLPPEAAIKAFDYVLTLAYVPGPEFAKVKFLARRRSP